MLTPKYLVDANILRSREPYRDYDESSFKIYWKNFDRLVEEGVIISFITVFEEIEKTKPPVYKWCVNNKFMFKVPNKIFYSERNIVRKNLPGWYQSKNEDKLWADRDLVVYAKAFGLTLVTQETPNFDQKKQSKYKIPTACMKLGAYCRSGTDYTKTICVSDARFQCINFSELVRREKLYENMIIIYILFISLFKHLREINFIFFSFYFTFFY